VPTIAEAGVSGYDFPIWYGLWGPARTPPAIADKVAADVATVLANRELRQWFTKHGADPIAMTRVEFGRFVLAESKRATRIIQNDSAEPK
jgi:tripartite-type tricarboxylate transporter receptor subunit TctC